MVGDKRKQLFFPLTPHPSLINALALVTRYAIKLYSFVVAVVSFPPLTAFVLAIGRCAHRLNYKGWPFPATFPEVA